MRSEYAAQLAILATLDAQAPRIGATFHKPASVQAFPRAGLFARVSAFFLSLKG